MSRVKLGIARRMQKNVEGPHTGSKGAFYRRFERMVQKGMKHEAVEGFTIISGLGLRGSVVRQVPSAERTLVPGTNRPRRS